MKASKRRFAFIQAVAFSFATVFLVACDDNPLTAAAEKEESYVQRDAAYCRNNGGTWDSYYGECNYRSSSSRRSSSSYSAYNSCLNNGGTWDWYYDYCNYGYSSSSYSTSYAYTTTQRTMKITTTYYRQTSSDWDVFDNAGDPEISYKITFKKKDSTTTSSWTSSHFLGTDTRSYATPFYDSLTVPVNTYSITIRPSVVDRDVSSNDDRSSGYYVTWSSVGYIKNYVAHPDTDSYGGYELRYTWELH